LPDPVLFAELARLTTEQRNARSMRIDTAGVEEILRIIHDEDRAAVAAVEPELSHIAEAVRRIVGAFHVGGRLVYAGAGTSGRLGILDASECPPTFGVPPGMVQGLIAGGPPAVFKAQEGAEDHEANGARDVEEIGLQREDVLCGIAASRRTPYVVGALREARRRGATTVLVTCNPRAQFDADPVLTGVVDVAICPDVGPEVVMGSTRMKSGTATKLVLNMLTTASMIRLGKVYENMMVDLQLTNNKLVERARRVIMIAAGVEYDEAGRALDAAGGHVKTALVTLLAGVGVPEARARLERGAGFVRHAVAGIDVSDDLT
jgi:N-acetylmuramic acid 6-phosphate etherase